MIVADTSAVLALLDRDDRQHAAVRAVYDETRAHWVLPWVVLPEVDYLLARRVGEAAQLTFLEELAGGVWPIEWAGGASLPRAWEICGRYRALRLGLTDSVVMAMAERLGAEAIATLDLRHFARVELRGGPKLYPRDWRS